MNRRKLILPLATAGIASILVVGAVAGQDPEDETDTEEQTSSVETRTGTVEAVTDADGDVDYLLTDESGTIKLSVGPPWFWGDAHPLNGVSGDVTVTGELDDGTPPAHANDNARDRADGEPSFDLFSLNGEEIRAAGKPPWAGGPAVVGESHPGYAGWSKGQAARNGAGESEVGDD